MELIKGETLKNKTEKKLWEKEFKNLLDYKLIDIDEDGRNEVFTEKTFTIN